MYSRLYESWRSESVKTRTLQIREAGNATGKEVHMSTVHTIDIIS
jgi:hypothetical protein